MAAKQGGQLLAGSGLECSREKKTVHSHKKAFFLKKHAFGGLKGRPTSEVYDIPMREKKT